MGLPWIGGEVSRLHFFIELFFGRALVATIRYFLQEDQITVEVVDTNPALNFWDHFFNFCDNIKLHFLSPNLDSRKMGPLWVCYYCAHTYNTHQYENTLIDNGGEINITIPIMRSTQC